MYKYHFKAQEFWVNTKNKKVNLTFLAQNLLNNFTFEPMAHKRNINIFFFTEILKSSSWERRIPGSLLDISTPLSLGSQTLVPKTKMFHPEMKIELFLEVIKGKDTEYKKSLSYNSQ